MVAHKLSHFPYVQSNSCRSLPLPSTTQSMMSVSMSITMMLVLHEHVFVATVDGERDRCDAQARKAAFKAIEACEGSRVSPCLPARHLVLCRVYCIIRRGLRSCPWVVCRCASCSCESFGVEASEVCSWSSPNTAAYDQQRIR